MLYDRAANVRAGKTGISTSFVRVVALTNSENLQRVQAQMALRGVTTTHKVTGGDLIYGESRRGLGLSIEMIVKDGLVTFLSLDDVYWSEYAMSGDYQDEALDILEGVVGGGAALVHRANGCHLICGEFAGFQISSVPLHERGMRSVSRRSRAEQFPRPFAADSYCMTILVEFGLVTRLLLASVERPPAPALPNSIFGAIVLFFGAIAVSRHFLNSRLEAAQATHFTLLKAPQI